MDVFHLEKILEGRNPGIFKDSSISRLHCQVIHYPGCTSFNTAFHGKWHHPIATRIVSRVSDELQNLDTFTFVYSPSSALGSPHSPLETIQLHYRRICWSILSLPSHEKAVRTITNTICIFSQSATKFPATSQQQKCGRFNGAFKLASFGAQTFKIKFFFSSKFKKKLATLKKNKKECK